MWLEIFPSVKQLRTDLANAVVKALDNADRIEELEKELAALRQEHNNCIRYSGLTISDIIRQRNVFLKELNAIKGQHK